MPSRSGVEPPCRAIAALPQTTLSALSNKSDGSDDGHCIWYGQCHSQGSLIQNCYYNGTAKPLTDPDGLKLLAKWCPHMVSPGVSTCCDASQLKVMDSNIIIAANFLQRCPSCVNNLIKHICEMSCATNQSKFIEVVSTQPVGNMNSNGTYITEINYYLTPQYMNGTYDSCKQVSVPSTGQLALDIMCGTWTSTRCTAKRWFDYMGNKDTPFVPFQINYKNTDATNRYIPGNPPVTPCSRGLDENTPACSCVDCEASCPAPQPVPPPPGPFKIMGRDGYAVIMLCVFLVGSGLFLFAIFVIPHASASVTSDSEHEMDTHNISKMPGDFDISSSFIEKLGANTDSFLQSFFEKWGTFCATKPWLVLFFGGCVVVALGHGIKYLKVTTDPVELWASPNSRSRIERDYYDSHFEPFYRNEQIIITSIGLPTIKHNTSNGVIEFGPVFNASFLLAVLELQEAIKNIGAGTDHSFEKICFAPLRTSGQVELSTDECAVQSLWGYYQDDIEVFEESDEDDNGFEVNYLDRFISCAQNPYNIDCLAKYNGPVDPAVAMGGFLKPGQSLADDPKFNEATAVIITFLVNNHHNKSKLIPAMEWEKKYVEFMKNWTKTKKPAFMDIAFTSERSIEDELDRESQSDVLTILISYIIMFAYIAVSLGQLRSCSRLLIDSKITLGLGGVFIVLASVISSVGIFGFIGVPATLIIIEVIPFLVLAVGVDNIFILVQTHQRETRKPTETHAEHIGRILGQVGPSMLLTSVSESCCFFLGGLSDMPAVRAFALYAGMALLFDFLLQITCFVSLLSLDTLRQTSNRYDICCFIKGSKKDSDQEENSDGILYSFFKFVYTPFIMNKINRAVIMVIFFGWLCFSIALMPHIEIGLDQELSMPEDSFVLKYFKYLKDFLNIGPPMYFVLKSGLNFTQSDTQNMICSGQYCDLDSLVTQVYVASKMSNVTYIGKPSSSWIDDYFDWTSISSCCKYNNSTKEFCPHSSTGKRFSDSCIIERECVPCNISLLPKYKRPAPDDFSHYISFFLQDNPDSDCAKAGHAAYGQGVNYQMNNITRMSTVGSSYFMAYHTILKTSKDYYESMRAARKISENITNTLNHKLREAGDNKTNIEVFPYSVFYVFYEQYLTMWPDTIKSLGISLLAIFVVTFLLMGLDIFSSIVVVITITMILVNLFGMMYWWHITLNAVSLVNLVMAVGISVEFCSHMVHSFSTSLEPTRRDRAADALVFISKGQPSRRLQLEGYPRTTRRTSQEEVKLEKDEVGNQREEEYRV
ncbi:npc intracellular cholesterol transporter 1 [Holotrichia oblita]|uniref:Npc intracellular cholesterol transporter 1 n=1 Tax=Holotrichia oblita TaxID=644536 RepID=A0ACB9SQP3_HOLOL|nr:npc intracellular cholesterol transporter 1 [Holotrichia oblita]